MPKTKEQKGEVIKGLKEKMAKSKSVVFATDKGLSVKVVEALRRELKKSGGEYLVAKKTLIKKAIEMPEDQMVAMDGSVGLVLSYEDAAIGPKLVSKVAKENEHLSLGAGFLEQEFILPEMVRRLASLPSREVLLGKLVGSLNAPLSGLVGVMKGNLRNLVGVMHAIKEKKA